MTSAWRWGALGLGLALVACGEPNTTTGTAATERADVQALEPLPPQDGVAVSSAATGGFRYLLVEGDTAFVGDSQVFQRVAGAWQRTSEYEILGLHFLPSAASADRI